MRKKTKENTKTRGETFHDCFRLIRRVEYADAKTVSILFYVGVTCSFSSNSVST